MLTLYLIWIVTLIIVFTLVIRADMRDARESGRTVYTFRQLLSDWIFTKVYHSLTRDFADNPSRTDKVKTALMDFNARVIGRF